MFAFHLTLFVHFVQETGVWCICKFFLHFYQWLKAVDNQNFSNKFLVPVPVCSLFINAVKILSAQVQVRVTYHRTLPNLPFPRIFFRFLTASMYYESGLKKDLIVVVVFIVVLVISLLRKFVRFEQVCIHICITEKYFYISTKLNLPDWSIFL